MQVLRIQLKLYKHLQLKSDQRASLANRWKSWCRRRHHLDKQIKAALLKLNNILDSSQSIRRSALKLAAAVARAPLPADPAVGCSLASDEQSVVEAQKDQDSDSVSELCAGAFTAKCVTNSNRSKIQGVSSDFRQANDSESEHDSSVLFSSVAVATLLVVDPRMSASSCSPLNFNLKAKATIQRQEHAHASRAAHAALTVPVPESSSVGHASGACMHQSRSSALDPEQHEGRASPRPFTQEASMFCEPDWCNREKLQGLCHDAGHAPKRLAWVACTACGKEKTVSASLLCESGEMMKEAQDALQSIAEAHRTDDMMQFEYLMPFWDLTEVSFYLNPQALFVVVATKDVYFS